MDQSASLVMMLCASFGEEDASEFLVHLAIGQFRGTFFGHNDNVAQRQSALVATEKFPEQTLHTVAPGCFAQTLGDHQP
jgi:hypothetical protein